MHLEKLHKDNAVTINQTWFITHGKTFPIGFSCKICKLIKILSRVTLKRCTSIRSININYQL